MIALLENLGELPLGMVKATDMIPAQSSMNRFHEPAIHVLNLEDRSRFSEFLRDVGYVACALAAQNTLSVEFTGILLPQSLTCTG